MFVTRHLSRKAKSRVELGLYDWRWLVSIGTGLFGRESRQFTGWPRLPFRARKVSWPARALYPGRPDSGSQNPVNARTGRRLQPPLGPVHGIVG